MIIVVLAFFAYLNFVYSPLIYELKDEYKNFTKTTIPIGLDSLSAKECGECHVRIYEEWQTSMHAKAYTNPYFQAYLKKDDYHYSCYYCHTQLEDQIEFKIVGFIDDDPNRPILDLNENFDRGLRDEGVTCATCHVANGMIYGPYGDADAPHPVEFAPKFRTTAVCEKCHEVPQSKFMFYKSNPCGTVDEYNNGPYKAKGITCQKCHMPSQLKTLTRSSKIFRQVGEHTFKGGHSKEMIKKALLIDVKKLGEKFELTVMNNGAGHAFPTGDPDRYVNIITKFYDYEGNILQQELETFDRTILYYPIIIEFSDNRLGPLVEITYEYSGKIINDRAVRATVEIEYHILSDRAHKMLVEKYGLPEDTEKVIKIAPQTFAL